MLSKKGSIYPPLFEIYSTMRSPIETGVKEKTPWALAFAFLTLFIGREWEGRWWLRFPLWFPRGHSQP